MSFRSWMLAIATGLAVLGLAWFSWATFSVYQENHANERVGAAEHYATASEKIPNSCGAIMDEGSVFDWLVCLGENITADGDAKQAEYDLKAQQDMAEWAFGMLIVTCWLAGITLLGVLFVWRTLSATKQTLIEAEKTTAAAVKTYETTRDIGEAQVRAYVYCENAAFEITKNELKVFVVIRNAGQSPAINVSIEGGLDMYILGGHPERPNVIESREYSGNTDYLDPVPSNGTSNGELIFQRDMSFGADEDPEFAEDRRMFDEANALNVSTAIKWSDVFGVEQVLPIDLSAEIGPNPISVVGETRISRGSFRIVSADPMRVERAEGN